MVAAACACALSGRPFAGGEQQDRIYGTVPVPLRPTNRAGALLTWSVVDDAPAAQAVGELEAVTLRLHLKDWSPPVRTHSSLRKRSAADLSGLSALNGVFSYLTTRVRRCRQDVIEVSYDGAPLGEPSDVTFPGVLRHEDGAESKYQVGDTVVWSWSMPAAAASQGVHRAEVSTAAC